MPIVFEVVRCLLLFRRGRGLTLLGLLSYKGAGAIETHLFGVARRVVSAY